MESEEFDFFKKLKDLGIEMIVYKGKFIFISDKYNTNENSSLNKSILASQENSTENNL